MSLTQDDLYEIRQVMQSVIEEAVTPRLKYLEGGVTALRNDIKEIYSMIA